MGKASSSKKVARAARAGGRTSGANERNLLFPGVIGLIVVLGAGLIAVAANERKAETDIAPVAGEDHWHSAYGFDICGEFLPADAENESRVGIHTHGDGVIHIHPTSDGGAGENATLGTFLADLGVLLDDDTLGVADQTWQEGEDQCDGEDAELVVAQWKDVETTDANPALIRRDFGDIRFREDGEGYTIAFVPEGTTDIPKPESAAQLTELGLSDQPGAEADAGTTVPEDTSGTTAPEDTSATTALPPAEE